MTTPAIHVAGLSHRFGDTAVLDDLDLTVPRGGIYTILGPNGAGKTTLLRLLATLLPIQHGTARIYGVDVANDPHQVRQLLSITGQYASVDENLTGRENLRFFARLLGHSASEAHTTSATLLDEFDLTAAADRPLRTYSGGMRRRLDLATTLISAPPLVFLDEPTTGLDPRTRSQMWDTIRRLVSAGTTVLLTTQYLDEADHLAHRVGVLDQGRIVAEGTPTQLKSRVGTSTLRVTPTDPAHLPAVADALTGVGLTPLTQDDHVQAPLTNTDIVADALTRLRADDIALTAVTVAQPSLDEVFLAFTGHPTITQENVA